jgi:hypothetical protein
MNKDYYDHCGTVMIRSFEKNWSSIPLHVYNEEFGFKSKTTIKMGWNLGDEYEKFQERWSNTNYKVSIFAKKAFSIIHAMENIECDRLIWADGDSQAISEINMQLLDLISPDNVLSTHFGVKHKVKDQSYFSCETGFFILNKTHQMFEKFKETYKSIYINDDYKNLRRFYDGEVYGETVLRLEAEGAEYLELNPAQKHKTPIPRSLLSPYITHYKAGLKDVIDFSTLEN